MRTKQRPKTGGFEKTKMTEAKQSLLTNSILLNRQYQGMFQAKLLANQNQEKGK